MWVVAKYKKNKYCILQKKIENKFRNSVFYRPRIIVNYFKNNKIANKDIYLFHDYIFIYNQDFEKDNQFRQLNFIEGIKFVLKNSFLRQNELNEFVSRCKYFEDAKGYLQPDFFVFLKKKYFKFSNGPLTNLIFSIIEETKKRIKILIGENSYIINKNKYLFFPI